ncbi:CheY-like superfamily [Helicostylum pulchrum]|uniref:Response regulatory domain-containing protein n=1 Tax=Helicostylum pulchrum TaxID=562976 RepID=A0ABP9XTT9_9FUNG|nr:CheY-like superfamily [Helicostylum pulchrum]
MDYFAYESKSRSASVDSTPDGSPSTPTIYIHDSGKAVSRPTCIRYSASLFMPDEIESSTTLSKIKKEEKMFNLNTLSSSLPSSTSSLSNPIILPSLSLPSKPNFKRRFSTPPPLNSPRLHVLIVDDNSINLQILSRLLNIHMSDSVEHVELVKSGIKALEILKCRPFDLILMDIDMPILNGVETTKHIRSSSEFDILLQNRTCPIVAVTTNDSDSWRKIYTEIGMNGCVGKPISPKKLKLTLSRVLGFHFPIPPYTPE